jgi:hypothetical protein
MRSTTHRGAPPRAPAPPAPPAVTPPPDQAGTMDQLRPLPTAAGVAFEQMLLAKYGALDLQVRRIPMPASVKQVEYVWIRETNSNDEVMAATWADAVIKPVERRNPRAVNKIEEREARRLSICAVWRRGQPAPEEVNGATPFLEINTWSTKFWAALEFHYLELNGLSPDDILKSLAGAVILGAPLPPNPNGESNGPGEEEASEGR